MSAPSAAERILDKLEGVKAQGPHSWTALCPAHGDKNPSLSVREVLTPEGEGRARVHCFAGCGDLDVLQAVGLTVRDLFDNPRGELSYVYNDLDGTPNRSVKRYFKADGSKGFRQSGHQGKPTILYRLPEVVAGVAAGKPVYLLEGEADVDLAFQEGLVATSSPQGASSWQKADYSPLQEAHRIVIVQDKDPAGRKRGSGLYHHLREQFPKVSVQLVEPKVAGDKVDFTDHFMAGFTTEDLVPVPLPEQGGSRPRRSCLPPRQGAGVSRMSDLYDEAQQWADTGASWRPKDLAGSIAQIKAGTLTQIAPSVGFMTNGTPLFYTSAINGIAGSAGSGKSFMAALLTKEHIEAGGTCFYIDWEATDTGLLLRLADMGADLNEIGQGLFYVQPETSFDDGGQSLLEILAEHHEALVIIDTVGEALAGDNLNGNEDKDVAPWFQKFPAAAARLGHCVVVIDHLPKNTDNHGSPIGSQRKQAAISGAQFIIKPGQAFSRSQDGHAVLEVAKDRHGHFAKGEKVARLEVASAGTQVAIVPEENTGKNFKPTHLMDKVTEFLASQPDRTASSLTAIREAVPGKSAYVSKAVRELVSSGVVVETPNKTRGNSYTLQDPFLANRSRTPYRGGNGGNDSLAASGTIGNDWEPLETNPLLPALTQEASGERLGTIGNDQAEKRGTIRPNGSRKETVKNSGGSPQSTRTQPEGVANQDPLQSTPFYKDDDKFKDCAGGCGKPLEKDEHPDPYCASCQKKVTA